MNPDFSLVYSQLDLRPDCSLEEFRSAYMRRIAELHPDRSGREPPTVEARALLQELVSTYAAVTRFHRRYGRMPGASPRVSGNHAATSGGAGGHGAAAANPMMTAMRPALQIAPASDPVPPERHSSVTLRLILIIVTLGLLLALWEVGRLLL